MSNLTKVNLIDNAIFSYAASFMTVQMLKGLPNINCLSLPNSLSLPKSHVDILLFFCHHHVAKLPIRAHRNSQSVKIRTFLWSDIKREVLGFCWAHFFLFKKIYWVASVTYLSCWTCIAGAGRSFELLRRSAIREVRVKNIKNLQKLSWKGPSSVDGPLKCY